MSQNGKAGRDLLQVGRDYIRYVQFNFSAGNWGTGILTLLPMLLLLGGLIETGGYISSSPPPLPTPTPTPTGNGQSGPNPVLPSPVDTRACVFTISDASITLMSEPSVSAERLIQVYSGEYTRLDKQVFETQSGEECWYEINVDGQTGWIQDDPSTLINKSGACQQG